MGFPTGTLFYNHDDVAMYEKTHDGFRELFRKGEIFTKTSHPGLVQKWDIESEWETWRVVYPKEELFNRLYLILKSS